MFQKAKNTAVFGGMFTVNQVHEGLNGRQILSQSPYVVHEAIHDSGERYPPSECHPGTREDVLELVFEWIEQPIEVNQSQIFWLSGPAGVGKTAIAQSLCQRLKELGRLGGDFFLSRSVAGHSDLHTLFPTLAYQLARAYPEFGLELDTIIKADQSILTKNMELQLEELIINPLKRVETKLDIPLILVIDGLDEAGRESNQTSLLRLLGFQFLHHHFPLKIFLTSRPEPWIKSTFSDNPLLGSVRSHFLHRTFQTDNDIRTFLKSKFAEIQRTHDLMKSRSDSWPSPEVIEDIVDRASGQFIYASTIVRYVEDPNGNPVERLQWVIKTPSTGNPKFTHSPLLALDNLYKHVLSTSLYVDRTLDILGAAISFVNTELSPSPTSPEISPQWLEGLERSLPPGPDPVIEAANIGIPRPLPWFGRNSGSTSSSPLPGTPRPKLRVVTSSRILSPFDSFPIDRIERIYNFQVGDGFLALRTIQSLVDISSNNEGDIKFYHKSFQDFLLDPNRAGIYFVDMNRVYSKLLVGALRHLSPEKFDTTREKRIKIHHDLHTISPRWVKWWLLSAASDEDRLLTEIKAIDQAVFYQSYIEHIARKVPFLLMKSYPKGIGELSKPHRSHGNIAESISSEIEMQTIGTTLGLSLERFLAAKTVLDKHFPSWAVKHFPGPYNLNEEDSYGETGWPLANSP